MDKDLAIALITAAIGAGGLAFIIVRAVLSVRDIFSKENGEFTLRSILTPFRTWVIASAAKDRELYRTIERYEKDIVRANGRFLGGADAYEIYAARFVLPILACIIIPLFAIALQIPAGLAILVALAFAAMLYLWPEQALADLAKRRTEQFSRDLPPALDVMCLVTQSGGDLMSAVQSVIEVTPPSPVREELNRALGETAIGRSLAQALSHIADRIDTPDASAVFSTLAQSLEMGTSVADNLASAAKIIRKNARIKAQEKAQKAVVAMTFPLLLLILPGVFIVLFGPLVIQFLSR